MPLFLLDARTGKAATVFMQTFLRSLRLATPSPLKVASSLLDDVPTRDFISSAFTATNRNG